MLISGLQAMQQYAHRIITESKVFLLSGPLGAGKTTLTKSLAESLGIDPNKVQSPTYTYINSYEGKLLHIDMYRLNSFDEVVEKGILDAINSHEYIVIEWPKWIDQLGIDHAMMLEIAIVDENTRKITSTFFQA